MRVRLWILVGSVSMGLAAAIAGGCGGSSDSGTADAGADVTTDTAVDRAAPVDTGADVAQDAGSSCVEDASLLTLSPPDASLADGATSVGLCLGCVRGSCGNELAACAGDCPCNNAIEGVIGCVLGGGQVLQCGAALAGLTGTSQTLGVSLGLCLQSNCQSVCAPGLDAGKKDSGGDAATDAPDDAPDAG